MSSILSVMWPAKTRPCALCDMPAWFLISWLLLCCHAVASPHAFSVTPSTEWYGDDGTWSAVSIRVGSPQQWVDVFVSTASSETWAVSPGGCDTSTICKTKRGGFYNPENSSTWHYEGLFELGLDTQLGFTGDATYGLDVLEFGTTGVSIQNSIIGSINTTEYWLGFLGLGNIPGNFTNASIPSPVIGLANASSIPSQSYGYTAGAKYQQKGDPVSLTLGGYDANRFIPHDVSFSLNADGQPVPFLNSISMSSSSPAGKVKNWTSNPLQILAPADGVYVVIDSSTPFLWLPKSTCEDLANALGLTYNDTLALYTFDGNASTHDDVRSWNLNFTFSISDTSSPSEIVNITLPFAAFDLQLSYPYIPNSSYDDPNKYYFPLRQAANETQYVIGRAFLQEAYLITDYERNNFSVYQALHNANPLGNVSLVDILSPQNSTVTITHPDQPTSSSHLSTPVIIGIAVGVAVLIILLALLIFFLRRRHRRRQGHAIYVEPKPEKPSTDPTTPKYPDADSPYPATSYYASPATPAGSHAIETDGTPLSAYEVGADADHQISELPGHPGFPEELDSRSISSSRAAAREGDAGEKFAPQIAWENENASGSKYRPSMRLKHDKGEARDGRPL